MNLLKKFGKINILMAELYSSDFTYIFIELSL